VFLLAVPTIVTAGNQGLSWAVPIGETRDFHLYRERDSAILGHSLIDETVTLNITEHPGIPDDITAWQSYDDYVGIPEIERVGYWENGTAMGQWAYLIITPVLLPVGNWTLVDSLLDDYLSGIQAGYSAEIFNDVERIGFRYSGAITDYSEIREAWWSKTDGMLIHYRWYEYDFRFEGLETESDIVVDAVKQPLPWGTIIFLGGAAGALLLVAGVVLMKRKR
jgi:hypothetical protein